VPEDFPISCHEEMRGNDHQGEKGRVRIS
jgi:hypothetical protein